ncbi:MAG TPA: serine acetyltransferase [Methylobacter sp.]
MFENIRADAMRAALQEKKPFYPIGFLRLLWEHEGLQVLVIYRFGRWLRDMRKYRYGWVIAAPLCPAYWILSFCARKAYDIDLDQSADIAPGIHITHFGGIEVRNCSIGPNCYIGQQVKLKPADDTEKGPVIGEGVYIGAHARICGNVRIGNGATIGAGAVVAQDIPPYCMVLGNPGRITQRDYDNRSFL